MCAQVLVERRQATSSDDQEPGAAGANGEIVHAYGNGGSLLGGDAHATLKLSPEAAAGGNASSEEGRSDRVSALIQRALADEGSGRSRPDQAVGLAEPLGNSLACMHAGASA